MRGAMIFYCVCVCVCGLHNFPCWQYWKLLSRLRIISPTSFLVISPIHNFALFEFEMNLNEGFEVNISL
jgi:hypothetical protein